MFTEVKRGKYELTKNVWAANFNIHISLLDEEQMNEFLT